MEKSSRRGPTDSSDWLLAIGALLVLWVMFIAGMALLMYGLDNAFICSSSSPVVTAEDAGRLQSAHFVDQLIRRQSIIETEKGSFVVCGTFPAIKDHALVLERRQDGNRMLCDPTEKICLRLAR